MLAEGYRLIADGYASVGNIFPQMQRGVDWVGPVMDTIEPERQQKLPAAELQQLSRDSQIGQRMVFAICIHVCNFGVDGFFEMVWALERSRPGSRAPCPGAR